MYEQRFSYSLLWNERNQRDTARRTLSLAHDLRAYLTFAVALRRSAQYLVILSDTARRAAADIRRVRFAAAFNERRTARRRLGNASSGNVRSIAMISARRRFSVTSAPVRARLRRCSALSPVFGISISFAVTNTLY
jgi:hypothetical protein